MTRIHRLFAYAAVTSLVALATAGECRAEWGRYRAVTSFSVPSAPVYTPAVVVQGAYRPLVVAPAAVAPVISGPISVTPPIIISQPQAAYYAPAPLTTYYAPAVTVRQTVVARPAFFPRARAAYYAPAVVAPAPILLP